jgi:hypothetical protein
MLSDRQWKALRQVVRPKVLSEKLQRNSSAKPKLFRPSSTLARRTEGSMPAFFEHDRSAALPSLGLRFFQSQFSQEFENIYALEISWFLTSGILPDPGEV